MFRQQLKHICAFSILSLYISQTVMALEPGASPQAPAGNTMGIPLNAPLPPGLYYTSSTKHLNGQLKDDNRDNMGLKLNAPASTSIFIYTPGMKVLGGDYRAWFAIPFIMAEENISNPMLGEPGKHSNNNIANIDVHFADIAWTLKPGQFFSAGLGAITTTGSWKQGGTNTSGEYWSINPRAGYSLMNQDWNISLESYYFYNFENKENKYNSGDELFFDATVLKKVDFIHQVAIKYVKYQTTELCLSAIKKNGLAIQNIRAPTEAMKLIAIEKNPMAIQFIEQPSNALCDVAVRLRPYAIQFLKRADEALWLEALVRKPNVIQFLDFYSETLLKTALKLSPSSFKYIPEAFKTQNICQFAMERAVNIQRHFPE